MLKAGWILVCVIASFFSYLIPNHFDLKYKVEKAHYLFEHTDHQKALEVYQDLLSFIENWFVLEGEEKKTGRRLIDLQLQIKLAKKIWEYQEIWVREKEGTLYWQALKEAMKLARQLDPGLHPNLKSYLTYATYKKSVEGKVPVEQLREVDFSQKEVLVKKISKRVKELQKIAPQLYREDIKKALKLYDELLAFKHSWVKPEKYDPDLENKIKERKAACHRELGEYEKAEAIYKELIETAEDAELRSNAQFQIGESYMRQKEYQKAIEQYQIVIEKYPQTRVEKLAYYGIAWAYYKMEDFTTALEAFIRLEREYPHDAELAPEARYRILQCLFNLEQYGDVRENYKAFEENPDYSNHRYADDAKLILADSLYALENFQPALELYQTLEQVQEMKIQGGYDVEKDPDLTDRVLLGLSKCYLEKGNLKKSSQHLEKIKQSYPKTGLLDEVTYLEAKIYYAQGKYQKAIANLERIIKEYPESRILDNVHYKLGVIYFELVAQDRANLQKALDHLKEIKSTSQLYRLAKIKIGEIYREIDINLAIEENRKILASEAEEEIKAFAQLNIGEIFYLKGNYDQAEIECQKVITNYGKTKYAADAKIYLGLIAKEKKEEEKAIKIYQDLLKEEKNISAEQKEKATFNLGLVYEQRGESETALGYFKKVAEEGSVLVGEAELQIINLLEKGKKIKEALARCDEILAREGISEKVKVRVRYKKGLIYYGQQEYEKARQEYGLALAAPVNEIPDKILYQISQCFNEEKKFKKSALNLEKIIIQHPNSDIITAVVYSLVLAYQKQGINPLVKIRKLIPKAEGEAKGALFLEKGILEETEGAFSQAEASFKKGLAASQQYNLKARHLFYLGKVLKKQRKFHQAIERLEEVIKKYPRSEVKELARYELADCYRHLISPQTSQYEQLALEIYHDLAKTKLYGPQALYKIASIYLKKRKIGQAVEVYEQILEHPEAEKKLKAYAQFGIGQAFYSYGDYEKAIENFVKVKEKHRVKKVLENAYFFLAECYWNLSEFDQARVHYEEFIKQFPKSKFVFNSLEAISECYERTGRLDLAVKTCDRLLARLPHHPKAAKIQLRKANLLFNDKKYVLARREYEKVIVQYPSAEEAAKAKASLKDCDEALALEGLEKAKKMYYFALQKSYAPDAEVYYEKAIKAFQKLIDKYPQTLTAINCQLYIANCWENLDQYKRALKLYEQIMEKIRTGDPRFGERLLSYVKEKIESLSDLEKF